MTANSVAETEALHAELARLHEQIAELRACEERYQAAFTNAPYNLALMDLAPDDTFTPVDANPMTMRAFGLSQDSEANFQRFGPEMLAQMAARLRACCEAGRAVEFEEQLLLGGQTIWTHAIYAPVGPGRDGARRVLITSFDITERKQQQQRDVAEREVMIERQAQALAELSTPLLALGNNVVVLPLVGAIDSRRAQQIMEALLDGVEQTRARMVIVDITGVAVVDTQVANALLRAAQATQLLGAQVILTGIRPEIAQTLVGLGVDLSSVITRSTLQAAVAYSLGA